jgi:pilus assembly protein CpaC
MFTQNTRHRLALHLSLIGLFAGIMPPATRGEDLQSPSIVHKIQVANERLEMTVNSSRLLTLDLKIPRAQVNNKDVVDLTPLSPNVIQIFAKKPGITQINLWDEKDHVHAIDVVVFGDARELSLVLQQQFPHATVTVRPSANSVILSGFVPEPDQAAQIQKIAEDYSPKVVNLLKVGGVQQVLLHVKVMEVSRTKLREMGFDFWTNNNSFFLSSTPSNLIIPNLSSGSFAAPATSGLDTVRFGVVSDNFAFFGLIDALRQYNLAKVMAEPTLVTVSGRPAYFNSGGELPYLVPAGLGTVSVAFKSFGTQVDFVPMVLGNGNIHLDVKPRVSFVDPTLSVTSGGITTPGFNVREVDTGVEMKAGQTLAIAGLVQNRMDYSNRGIPYLADLPYFGALFRKVHEQNNEIELVVMVTPELVEPMNPCDVPPCLPGMSSREPNDCELYWKGHPEVPSCGPCAAGDCLWGGEGHGGGPMMAPGIEMGPAPQPGAPQPGVAPVGPANPSGPVVPKPPLPSSGTADPKTSWSAPRSSPTNRGSSVDSAQPVAYGEPVSYNRSRPQNPRSNPSAASHLAEPNLIGPVGYDVVK